MLVAAPRGDELLLCWKRRESLRRRGRLRQHARRVRSPDLTIWPFYDHNLVMKSVSVAELKSKLSQYLAAVRSGKEIVVTSHRHSIARIVPVEQNPTDLKIIPARKPISSLKKIKGIKLDVDLVADLLADRRRR